MRKDGNSESLQYCFGQRYYYWPYYIHNNNFDNIYNPGYKYKDWFIYKKFTNLKEEMLNKLKFKKFYYHKK